jgi:WhiB family redox-sensing transcriptional regulator
MDHGNKGVKVFDTTDANCATSDPDLFFLEGHQWHLFQQVFDICAACPLAVACLDYAIDNNEEYGIWGGAGPSMRTRMSRGYSSKKAHIIKLQLRGAELANTNNEGA